MKTEKEFVLELSHRGHRVVGIDFCPTSHDEMKRLLVSNGVWPIRIFETYVDGVLGMGWWK